MRVIHFLLSLGISSWGYTLFYYYYEKFIIKD